MNRGWARRIQDAQGDLRADLRADQESTQLSPLQPAWKRKRPLRVEDGVRGKQPVEAVPERLGAGHGIKQREKVLVYRKQRSNPSTSN